MAEISPPLFQDVSSVYSGDELGLPYRDIVGEGIVLSGDLAVSQRGAGANLSVDVAAGACWVVGDTNTTRQPTYRCINDAVVNKGITPDPSNPRKVLVVAQVTDEGFAGTGRLWAITAIHGTPGASPAEPALPASALPLALIDVTAADVDITNAQITDRRRRATLPGQLATRLIRTPFTANVSVTATTEATANTVVTQLNAIYFDGATTIEIDCGAMAFDAPSAAGGTLTHVLYDSLDGGAAASIGIIGSVINPAAAALRLPGKLEPVEITPAVGRHVYSWRAFVSTGTGTVVANVGGAAATNYPGYIKLTRVVN